MALSGVAGCGYAAGPGDELERFQVGDELPGIGNIRAMADERIILAYREHHSTALPSLEHEPRLGVYDWTGEPIAMLSLDAPIVDLAVAERIAIQTEAGLLVSVPVDRLTSEGWTAWSTSLAEDATPVGTRGAGVVVRTGDTIQMLVDASIVWTATFDGPIASTLVTADRVVASGGGTVSAFDHEGTSVWSKSVTGAGLSGHGKQIVIHTPRSLMLVDDGELVWDRRASSIEPSPRLAGTLVLVSERTGGRREGRLVGIDRSTGDERFVLEDPSGTDGPVAATQNGVVLVDDDCTVWGIQHETVTWRRSLDRDRCRARAVRRAADHVAVLFGDGAITRYQHVAAQPRGWAP